MTDDWGTYEDHARALKKALNPDAEPSPVALRLAVGAIALGAKTEVVASRFDDTKAATLSKVAQDLVDQLMRPALDPCRRGIGRLLLARRPLARATAVHVSGIPEEHQPLVTKCVGYGEAQVRISAAARKWLSNVRCFRLDPQEEERAHEALASRYAEMDGRALIGETEGDATVAWLEKQHHLSCVASTALQELPCRELYWARGRYLSKVRRDRHVPVEEVTGCPR